MNLYTSYFRKQCKMELPDTAYMSIAVGNPRYSVPYEIIDLKPLKPYGIFGKYEGDAYREKYFERLDKYGVDWILREINRLRQGHENVMLMCHEKDKSECHRSLFAEWWLLNTGEVIPEYGEKEAENEYDQLSLF